MDRQKVTIQLGGRAYTLLTSDPPEHIRRVEAYADRALRETATAAHAQPQQAAALALISVTDELIRTQDEITRLRRQLRSAQEQA